MNKLAMLPLLLSLNLAIAGCGTANNLAQSTTPLSSESPTAIITSSDSFSYQDYAGVLKTYVNEEGLVNYKELQNNREQLKRFNQSIGALAPEVYRSWSDAEKLSFLINAYNSFTLQSIIDQKPLKTSIRKIPGVWKRRQFAIAGDLKTLDNIEHDIIRQEFNEPRIHAALVCAAVSCPPLRNEPYLPEKLEAQLEDQVTKWLTSPQGLIIDRQQNRVELSAIFNWYGKDWITDYDSDRFTENQKERAVLNFISQYLEPQDRQYLEQGNYKVRYLSYNWSLNEQN